MTYQSMKDDELQEVLLKAVQRERQWTIQVLEMLKEVEERRLFAKRGYSSLYQFCIEYLGYSEGAAHRRISSMRLMKDVPEVRTKIESGTIKAKDQWLLSVYRSSNRKEMPMLLRLGDRSHSTLGIGWEQ